MTDALSRLPNNENQETTHESTYTTETMSELYKIKELPEGAFPLSFKLIDLYQQEESTPMENLKCVKYRKRVLLQRSEYHKTYNLQE